MGRPPLVHRECLPETALKRGNCRLIRCFARKVVMEGRRAVGVEGEIGQIEVIRANREVIVAASAFNSPKS